MKLFTVTLLCSLLLPSIALAQSAFLPNQLELAARPGNPRPGEQVVVEASSRSIDLDRSNLSWKIAGKAAGAGIGKKSITVTVGPSGTSTTVSVTATAPSGQSFSASVVLRPGAVDLLWQADSYTPPFYKGKALLAAKAPIHFSAITATGVGGAVAAEKNLIYTWKKGSVVLGEVSGRGKSSLTLEGPVTGGSLSVSVEVVDGSGASVGSGFVQVTASDPRVIIYRNDPLQGVLFENALPQDFHFAGQENTLTAYPYFFSSQTRTKSLSYKWAIDGRAAESVPGDQSSIVLRQGNDTFGSSIVTVAVEHLNNLLQDARASLPITFGVQK